MDELLETFVPGGAWLALGLALGTAFSAQLRPVAKVVIKTGMIAGERLQEVAMEAYEQGQDLVAEAQLERKNEAATKKRTTRSRTADAEA